MRRVQLAGYCLLASAFVLAGLVFVQASRHMENRAFGEMVVNKDFFSMVTTQAQNNMEVLYVLNTKQEKLLAYRLNEQERIEIVGHLDIGRVIQKAVR